ncbi:MULTISPECIES: transglycosylase family protein [Rhodococcus]|uniref:Resuscitation-promoting factor core lysozyme-like domain-containing protein n=1 Tax=Rhodococcus opacus RKJ300 = JCM 13270 TaxID=1165867 RepID=I0WZQ1_RHOOP|nr:MULTISPECIES: transglycosylase family protein [Rhodococcus]EID81867.1 hypothetical protein W59_01039 [Rhodococcus opacus RKJ300 = JCM 13270]QQZ16875.1 transglycosylase family protein [Rhodococcus sp. 21391]
MTTRNMEKHTLGWIALIGAAVTVLLGLGAGTAGGAPHDWEEVAECESGGDWTTDTGNGFYGGLQFTPETWKANGGTGMASEASQAEQIRVAENVLKTQGPGAWPVCGQYLKKGGTAPVEVPHTTPAPAPAIETPDPVETPDVVEAPATVDDSAAVKAAVKAAAQEALNSARELAEQNGSAQVFEERASAPR